MQTRFSSSKQTNEASAKRNETRGKGERKSGGEKVHDLGIARKDKLLKPERTVELWLLLDCKNGLFFAQFLLSAETTAKIKCALNVSEVYKATDTPDLCTFKNTLNAGS